MPSSSPTEAPAPFICACEKEWMRSACVEFGEYECTGYCVLHYPSKDKSAAFNEAFKGKLDAEDFDFRGVWFPDVVDFSNYTFATLVDFFFATFSAEAQFLVTTFGAGANFRFAKFSAKVNFLLATFNAEADFRYATFSAEANFDSVKFNAEAHFNSATFNARADFSAMFGAQAVFHLAEFNAEASFYSATFNAQTDFYSAKFGAVAHFSLATFSAEVNFLSATFGAMAIFDSTTFSAATNFRSTTFGAVASFDSATFKDHVRFAGDAESRVFGNESSLSLQFARIENPDRLSFYTITLRPHWFVNVDARKFEFINVNWNNLNWSWRDTTIIEEIESLQRNNILSAHRLLAIACRNLAVNAEENHRYEEASKFRYMAMDARRLQWIEKLRGRGLLRVLFWALKKMSLRLLRSLKRDWGLSGRTKKRVRRFSKVYWRSVDFLHWLYWVASGYGERTVKAFIGLSCIWLLAAALYTQVGFVHSEPRVTSGRETAEARSDEVGEPLKWLRALTYSLGVMTLQKPEPRPATNAAQALVMLETILGPVQAALLALAIRRKFMR